MNLSNKINLHSTSLRDLVDLLDDYKSFFEKLENASISDIRQSEIVLTLTSKTEIAITDLGQTKLLLNSLYDYMTSLKVVLAQDVHHLDILS